MAKSIYVPGYKYSPPGITDIDPLDFPARPKIYSKEEILANNALLNPNKKVAGLVDQKTMDVITKTVKPIDYQKRNSTASMILNGTNALVSGILGYASMRSIDKMKPELVPNAPVIEGAKMRDTGAQQFAAGRSSIVRSIATARRDSLALGLTNLNPVYAAKDIEANNDLSGRIEGMRATIDQTNTQIENNVNQLNAGNKMNIANINANILNNFQSMKAQAESSVISGTLENINKNISGIGETFMMDNAIKDQERKQRQEYIRKLNENISMYSAAGKAEVLPILYKQLDALVGKYKNDFNLDPLTD